MALPPPQPPCVVEVETTDIWVWLFAVTELNDAGLGEGASVSTPYARETDHRLVLPALSSAATYIVLEPEFIPLTVNVVCPEVVENWLSTVSYAPSEFQTER